MPTQVEGLHWTRYAACIDNPDLWNSEQQGRKGDRDAAQAIHICKMHCPVLEKCKGSIKESNLPRLGVLAGIRWRKIPDSAGPELLQPEEIGCGPWCREHRGL